MSVKLPSSLTLRRFRVDGGPIGPDEAIEGLARKTFPKDLDVPIGDGELRGWTSFGNLLDLEPDEATWVAGGRLFFGLRIDQKRAPAALVRARVELEEKARKQASGKAVLPGRIRREIKEDVVRELAAASRPNHSHYAAMWHFQRQEIFLLSASENVADRFRDHFRETFERQLVTLRPAWRARFVDLPSSSIGALDGIRPSSFGTSAPGEPPVDEFEVHRLLGREFLTWLWHRIEETGGVFEWPGLGRYGMMVGDGLDLDGEELESTRDSFRRGHPAEEAEARIGLLSGKKVGQIRLIVARDEAEWRFTWTAPTLDVGGLKLPRSENKQPEDILDDRLSSLEEIVRLQDALYHDFLLARLGPEWRRTTDAMRTWVASIRQEVGVLEAVGA